MANLLLFGGADIVTEEVREVLEAYCNTAYARVIVDVTIGISELGWTVVITDAMGLISHAEVTNLGELGAFVNGTLMSVSAIEARF